MNKIGIIEGFFGPAWDEKKRFALAPWLSKVGGDFYLFAPKQEPRLRKKWKESWVEDFFQYLKNYQTQFETNGVTFGVGFTPFGLSQSLDEVDQTLLIEKIEFFNRLGLKFLGLFFDDLPVTENLAGLQLRIVDLFRKHFRGEILFCPSFYTFDPILDKVFGKRPETYWDEIRTIQPEINLAWTGPKVISPEISLSHLLEVRALLGRDPFIWENLFANDGPRNCKFLKLKPFTGRESGFEREISGLGLNMMNQIELSKITFLATVKTIQGLSPELAFREALLHECPLDLAEFILQYETDFNQEGLDKISQDKNEKMITFLSQARHPVAVEILDWLNGKYTVGSECLTD